VAFAVEAASALSISRCCAADAGPAAIWEAAAPSPIAAAPLQRPVSPSPGPQTGVWPGGPPRRDYNMAGRAKSVLSMMRSASALGPTSAR
jgi:hypothetical protein